METKLDPVVRQLADHLSFLGYEAEEREGKNHPYLYLRHQRNPNFMIDTFLGAVKCTVYWGLSPEGLAGSLEMFTLLNELNRQALGFKIYTDEDSLILELVIPREYSKASFGAFWSVVESDFRLVMDGRLGPFLS
jgi:hypothetical protein